MTTDPSLVKEALQDAEDHMKKTLHAFEVDLRAYRTGQVTLIADHTVFGEESVIQVAAPTVVQKLITDDALPASVRLVLNKLGIQIVIASI